MCERDAQHTHKRHRAHAPRIFCIANRVLKRCTSGKPRQSQLKIFEGRGRLPREAGPALPVALPHPG